jgi:magnesium transporter
MKAYKSPNMSMLNERNKILADSIMRLLRRDAISHLKKIINRAHPADLARVFIALPATHRHQLFNMIEDPEKKGLIFSELDRDTFLHLVKGIQIDEIVRIFEHMPSDDVADLLGKLPRSEADSILEKMQKEGSDTILNLLRYGEDTAGGIMVPDFIALKEDTTAKQAIASIQKEHYDVEMPFYLYVVDDNGRLVGVCSLRQLVVVPPETPLKDFMTRDVFSVRTDMDQEEVAKIVARYDFLAVPVLDHEDRLVGIVTVDDVIDIIRREATEDMFKMVGVGQDFVETKSILKSTRIRLPWLFASCLGGIFAFFIIGHFEESLKAYAFLAAFIPVIMGMGGNIGTQSSTIVVRGLATGKLSLGDFWTVIFKELSIGLILGIIYGTLIGSVAQLRFSVIQVAISVGLAVVSSMSIAALVGSMVPMGFAKIKIDPAVATGPFVTTAIDIISVFFYFQLATILLGL